MSHCQDLHESRQHLNADYEELPSVQRSAALHGSRWRVKAARLDISPWGPFESKALCVMKVSFITRAGDSGREWKPKG